MLARIGWIAGCWYGYPNRWWKRLLIVKWLADHFDPWNQEDNARV